MARIMFDGGGGGLDWEYTPRNVPTPEPVIASTPKITASTMPDRVVPVIASTPKITPSTMPDRVVPVPPRSSPAANALRTIGRFYQDVARMTATLPAAAAMDAVGKALSVIADNLPTPASSAPATPSTVPTPPFTPATPSAQSFAGEPFATPRTMPDTYLEGIAPRAGAALFGQTATPSAASPTATPRTVQAVMPPPTTATPSGGGGEGGGYRSYSGRRQYYSGGGRYYSGSSRYYSGGGGSSSSGDFSALPPTYIAAFATAFNKPLEQYYTAERGGAQQAIRDYQNIANLWQYRTGRPITPDELTRLLMSFDAYTVSLGRDPTIEDLITFITTYTERTQTPQPVSYLNLLNI